MLKKPPIYVILGDGAHGIVLPTLLLPSAYLT
jgi:hypothetical protein